MPSLSENFKDSFNYPIQDLKKFLIIGVILLFANLGGLFVSLNITNETLPFIFAIISFIIGLIFYGFIVAIIKESINDSNILPDLDLAKNIVDGIKVFIMEMVYGLITFIIILIVAIVSGSFTAALELINFTITNPGASLPTELIYNFIPGFIIVCIVLLILAILFLMFTAIGFARLAKYDSLAQGLNIPEIIKDIGKIGWFNFIAWLIIAIIISWIIGIIAGFIFVIPIAGWVINSLILFPFLYIFLGRSLGLVYTGINE